MTLVLRYAPGKKLFSVQPALSETVEILAQIPQDAIKDFVNIDGQYYALTPQMYARARAFKTVVVDLPVSSAKVAQEKVSKAIKKPASKLVTMWNAITGFFSRKGVPA